MKLFTTTIKPENLFMIQQTMQFTLFSYFAPRSRPYVNLKRKIREDISFGNMVHFFDEENIVTYVNFDFGFFRLWRSYKSQLYQPRLEKIFRIL